MMVPLLFALAAATPQAADMTAAAASGIVDGRPAPADLSPVQRLIDEAPAGATVEVPPGRYAGDIIVDKPLRLVGRARPLLVGSRRGSVVRIRSNDVVVEGFDIDGLSGGDLGRDSSGVHIAAQHVIVRSCRIRNTMFGVYLREADESTVDRCVIRGIPGKDPGEKGSGIHVWNTTGFTLAGNDIADVRDGFYIQSSSHGVIAGNTARDLRYGLHYMFSDDNTFEDNTFSNGAAGTALMYSRRIVFRRNRFVHNRGFASVGLLFKECDDVAAEDNLIADNARGVFLEGSYRNRFRRNVIAESDTAIVLYDSSSDNIFEGNSFVGNLTPLTLSGRRTDAKFDGNYWSDNDGPDLDGDGRSDVPYRLSSVFDHFRSNLTAADLLTPGFAATALGLAERTFPVLDPIPVEDHRPLARPPVLAAVPRPASSSRRADTRGLTLSVLAIAVAAAVFRSGRAS